MRESIEQLSGPTIEDLVGTVANTTQIRNPNRIWWTHPTSKQFQKLPVES